MAKKVAINGFGRIGRNTLRAAIREGIFDQIDYVAIKILHQLSDDNIQYGECDD